MSKLTYYVAASLDANGRGTRGSRGCEAEPGRVLGIPLFNDTIGQTALKLKETKVYDCGVILLGYDVTHSKGAA